MIIRCRIYRDSSRPSVIPLGRWRPSIPGGFLATQRLVMVPYLISLGSRSDTDTLGCRFPISDHKIGARTSAEGGTTTISVEIVGDKRSCVSLVTGVLLRMRHAVDMSRGIFAEPGRSPRGGYSACSRSHRTHAHSRMCSTPSTSCREDQRLHQHPGESDREVQRNERHRQVEC